MKKKVIYYVRSWVKNGVITKHYCKTDLHDFTDLEVDGGANVREYKTESASVILIPTNGLTISDVYIDDEEVTYYDNSQELFEKYGEKVETITESEYGQMRTLLEAYSNVRMQLDRGILEKIGI